MPDPSLYTLRGQRAAAVRHGNPDAAKAAARALTYAKVERAVLRALAADPPITLDQRNHLASVLASGRSA